MNKARPGATKKRAVSIKTKETRLRRQAPAYDAQAASARFVQTMTWITVIGLLFCVGQGLRLNAYKSQLDRIESVMNEQYQSVLGEDLGAEPFGRLQFVHGRLAAEEGLALDPLAVMASLSRHMDDLGRIDSMHLNGTDGRVKGYYLLDRAGFDEFVKGLEKDEDYVYELDESSEGLGGIEFILFVERK